MGSPLPKRRRPLLGLLTEENCEKDLANKKKLLKLNNEKHNFHAGTNIFVKENLTPMNESIAFNCRKLKRSGLIHACRNGNVYVKENETGHSKCFI